MNSNYYNSTKRLIFKGLKHAMLLTGKSGWNSALPKMARSQTV